MTASLLVLLAGCAPEELVVSFGYDSEDERNLTLTLQFKGHDSRAVMIESDLNENKIEKVDLFLYPTNVTDVDGIVVPYTSVAIVSKKLTEIEGTSTAEGFIKNNDGSVTVKIKVSSSDISTLFPQGSNNQCTAYAIANGPDIPDNLPTSISNLKGMTITSSFANGGIQKSFAMDGEDKITLNVSNEKKSLSGDIALVRAAAKITLRVAEIVNEITEGGVKWTPEVDNMKVFFYNGVNASKLNATADDASSRFNLPFGANGIDGYTFASSTENSKTVYNQEIPFYSYPSDWSGGDAANEAYLVLLLPWKKEEAAQWTSFYYKIPISHIEGVTSYSKLDRNTHYQIDVTVGILGAEEDKGEVILTPKYTLLDWGTQTVNATLDKAHYLVVDKKEVKVYNQNQVEIGYKASENISVVITKIEREDLSGNNVGTTTFFPKTGETSASTVAADRKDKANKYTFMKECSVTKDAKNIILAHDLVNEDENSSVNADGYQGNGDDYDFTPYYITLLVTMNYTDGNGQTKTMTEEIKVIQYPEVYIEAKQNSDYGDNDPNDDHNVMVNAYYGGGQYTTAVNATSVTFKGTNSQEKNTVGYFGSVTGLTSNADNQNPNMYVVNVTSLSLNSKYIIGDPRAMDIDTELVNEKNNNNSIWATATALNADTPRRLTYYYPTDRSRTAENSGESNNPDDYKTGYMIAPKFRVASSYSVIYTGVVTSVDLAEKRCASYQEDGYPAGRWRLPTYAEAAFIVSLSNEKKIPYLFNTGTNYWCAHGDFKPNGNNVDLNPDGNANSVRCVYDEWYWGSDQIANKSTFTWGDAPRATTGN